MSDLNPKLDLRQQQKLAPQQIQLIKLLELPAIELEQRIKQEIEENPLLEEYDINEEQNEFQEINQFESNSEQNDEETDTSTNENQEQQTDNNLIENPLEQMDEMFEEYEEEYPSYKIQERFSSDDENPNFIQNTYSETISLIQHLEQQIEILEFTEDEKFIANYIIGNIEDDGYFRKDLISVKHDLILFYNFETSLEQIEKIFYKLQEELEPAGVLARNLQECLLIQINRKIKESPNNQTLQLASTLIKDYFELFAKKHYDKIKQKLNISSEELKQVIDIILKLNPRPGLSYLSGTKKNEHQIVPDFIVEIIDNEPYLSLNTDIIPSLRINKEYQELLKRLSKKNKEKNLQTANFIKEKIESAKWFMDAIEQRNNTLEKCMKTIISLQKDFFITGQESKLKPMILKDIAEKTNLDVSTISRVVNSKYVQTPWGIFPLKFFFSEGIETDLGEEVSTKQIKQLIKEAIDKEDKTNPLTDDKLTQILQQNGYNIARRTIAKYRESMGIPVARLRKKI